MRSTWAEIRLDYLQSNALAIANVIGSRGIVAMIKANAYGHGIIEVAKTLEQLNVEFLGVAFVQEAIQLRKAGINSKIMVLTPNEVNEADDVVAFNLTPVICSRRQAAALNASAQRMNTIVHGHLYVDTGMRRDGLRSDTLAAFVPELISHTSVRLSGVCTHLATSDDEYSPFVAEQKHAFKQALDYLRSVGLPIEHVHVSATGGISHGLEEYTTLARPGLSLYGYQHFGSDMGLKPVMSVHSSVIDTRTVQAGESVGYGQSWVAPNETRIATLPMGYGDGYLRALSNRAQCIIKGRRYPIVGTICMDECMVNVGDSDVAIGDDVVLLGTQHYADRSSTITAIDIAQWADTIPYEITTAISARVPRVYVQPTESSKHQSSSGVESQRV